MTSTATQSHDYTHLIGSQLTVGYGDHNDAFAVYLPRTGTVVRQIALEDWGSDWLILQLVDPFDYQLGSLHTGFRAVVITHFLIRSRWDGCPIGARQTSVFLLLDPDRLLETKHTFRSTDFLHICWGTIPP
jgi:hypothetical protein